MKKNQDRTTGYIEMRSSKLKCFFWEKLRCDYPLCKNHLHWFIFFLTFIHFVLVKSSSLSYEDTSREKLYYFFGSKNCGPCSGSNLHVPNHVTELLIPLWLFSVDDSTPGIVELLAGHHSSSPPHSQCPPPAPAPYANQYVSSNPSARARTRCSTFALLDRLVSFSHPHVFHSF